MYNGVIDTEDGAGPGFGDGCDVCSTYMPIYHVHFSSRRARILSGAEQSSNKRFCISCLEEHVPYPGEAIEQNF